MFIYLSTLYSAGATTGRRSGKLERPVPYRGRTVFPVLFSLERLEPEEHRSFSIAVLERHVLSARVYLSFFVCRGYVMNVLRPVRDRFCSTALYEPHTFPYRRRGVRTCAYGFRKLFGRPRAGRLEHVLVMAFSATASGNLAVIRASTFRVLKLLSRFCRFFFFEWE